MNKFQDLKDRIFHYEVMWCVQTTSAEVIHATTGLVLEKKTSRFVWRKIPVQDVLQEVSYQIGIAWFNQKFHDIKYWFLYRFVKRHKYYIVKPRYIPVGYIDPTEMILHTNFELLCRFIENEFDSTDWEYDDDMKEKAWEMKNLYKWWKWYNSSAFNTWVESHPGGWADMHEPVEDAPEYDYLIGWQDWVEQRNLMRLIKIRRYLWS